MCILPNTFSPGLIQPPESFVHIPAQHTDPAVMVATGSISSRFGPQFFQCNGFGLLVQFYGMDKVFLVTQSLGGLKKAVCLTNSDGVNGLRSEAAGSEAKNEK